MMLHLTALLKEKKKKRSRRKKSTHDEKEKWVLSSGMPLALPLGMRWQHVRNKDAPRCRRQRNCCTSRCTASQITGCALIPTISDRDSTQGKIGRKHKLNSRVAS